MVSIASYREPGRWPGSHGYIRIGYSGGGANGLGSVMSLVSGHSSHSQLGDKIVASGEIRASGPCLYIEGLAVQ